MTGHLIMQDTPTCRAETVKEIAGGFVRLGEKATAVLRRLEERPAFPLRNSTNNSDYRLRLEGLSPEQHFLRNPIEFSVRALDECME